ncbi:hypothetical protein, partial [Xanthomonas hortorum]|uniref:hypothetical protein n=1 Tax=Xanthomonas hortorum TaxID=56454 RepID=UPI0019D3B1A9
MERSLTTIVRAGWRTATALATAKGLISLSRHLKMLRSMISKEISCCSAKVQQTLPAHVMAAVDIQVGSGDPG